MRLMYYEDYSRHGCLVKYFTQVRSNIRLRHSVWFLTICDRMKQKVRDPVDRFISRFNFNRWEEYLIIKMVSDTWTYDLYSRDLVDENKWMQGARFYVKQQRERLGSNLTKCILSKQPECVYKVPNFYCRSNQHHSPIFSPLPMSPQWPIRA